MIGKKVLHYKIIAKLGEGGMGVLYKAEDTRLERTVALKFLPKHIASDADERKRFEIEAKAAAALNHPNIATIYAIEEHDDETPNGRGKLFIVMEYIDGKELQQVASRKLQVEEIIEYATQIADGLEAAHAKGIIHRDIKSSNIMVTESGQVKIMDFGLAKIGGGAQLTKDQTTLGTAAYMSPEQARGENVDQRTDIWSFGVVLYEMLTGELPFRGEYEQVVMYSIMNEEPEYPNDLPANLKPILEKALAKDSAQRFQHAGELLADLSSTGINAKPGHSQPTAAHRRPRNLLYLIGGAGLLILILAVWFLRTTGSNNQTIDSIAVEKEPEFAPGYVGIVRASTGLMDLGGLPFSELYPIAKSALDKALQIGDSRAEVYSILGRFKHIAEWDWAGAEKAFRKSLERNPNLSNTYFDYASFLIAMDRGDEALAMIKKARALDPLNAGTNNDVGWIYYCVRRYDEAIREYRNNLEMYPDFVMSHRELGWVYAKKSMFLEAIQSVQRAVELERSSYNLAQLAIVYALAGQRDETFKILDELLSGQDTEQIAAYEFAMIYSALGDIDKAFKWLEISYQEHSGWPFLIKVDPIADSLRSDPRYGPFLRRMGLEP